VAASGAPGNRTALDQVDVEQPVLVEVQQRAASHQKLGVVVVADRAVAVDEIETRFGSALEEDGLRRGNRRRHVRAAVRFAARRENRSQKDQGEGSRTPHGRSRHYPRHDSARSRRGFPRPVNNRTGSVDRNPTEVIQISV